MVKVSGDNNRHSLRVRTAFWKIKMLTYIPINGVPPYNVLLAFHGFGIEPRHFFKHGQLWSIANCTNSILLVPRTKGLNWGGISPYVYHRSDFIYMKECLDSISVPVTKKLFLTGFSDGASFAISLGIEWNTEITAIAPYAGVLQRPVITSNKFPVLICGNAQDHLVKPKETQEIVSAFIREKHPVKYYQSTGGHGWHYDALLQITDFLASMSK
jgi:hypothetical protein